MAVRREARPSSASFLPAFVANTKRFRELETMPIAQLLELRGVVSESMAPVIATRRRQANRERDRIAKMAARWRTKYGRRAENPFQPARADGTGEGPGAGAAKVDVATTTAAPSPQDDQDDDDDDYTSFFEKHLKTTVCGHEGHLEGWERRRREARNRELAVPHSLADHVKSSLAKHAKMRRQASSLTKIGMRKYLSNHASPSPAARQRRASGKRARARPQSAGDRQSQSRHLPSRLAPSSSEVGLRSSSSSSDQSSKKHSSRADGGGGTALELHKTLRRKSPLVLPHATQKECLSRAQARPGPPSRQARDQQ
jgi:hypothetical protein